MTDYKASDRDVNRAIRSWLHSDRHEDASRIAGAVLDQVTATPRRRAGWPAWRTPIMNKLTIGLGVAAVVVIGLFLGYQLLGSPGNLGGPGGEATATAEPTATPEPSVAEPTSTPAAFLPEGPVELAWEGLSDSAPRITVTIPASGWTEDGGILVAGDEVDNLPEAAIISFSESPGTSFFVYGDPCRWPSTTPETPTTTVDEIAAALAAQASREATDPVDVTVGGYGGKAITLHVPDDANVDGCEGGEFATFGTETDDIARYHQGPGQIDELWIIDVDGAIVILDAMYRPDSQMALVDQMRSIVESATFELP